LKTVSVVLDDHLRAFVDAQVQTSRYWSAQDVILTGLHLLEAHIDKISALQDALIEGEQSGEPREFDKEEFLKMLHAKHRKGTQ